VNQLVSIGSPTLLRTAGRLLRPAGLLRSRLLLWAISASIVSLWSMLN
jgi:hypothetical protein